MIKTINVEGMSCGHCENRVKNALSSVAGLIILRVSASDNIAEVEIADENMLKAAVDAIEDAGYDVIPS
jgi:copper chaperone CopZ